jgi:hypothetical protein
MAAEHAKQDQLDMVTAMFEHLANEPKLYWLAMQFTVYESCVSDTDEQSQDYLDLVMDELSIVASEFGDLYQLDYDPDRHLEKVLSKSEGVFASKMANASLKTEISFLCLLAHELSTDVS